MGKGRFIDFDDILGKRNTQPIMAKIKGQQYFFPAELPAALILKIQRMEEQGVEESKEITVDETMGMYEDLLGKANLEKIIQSGASMNELQIILEGVMSAYGDDGLIGEPKKVEAAEVTQQAETTEFRLS